MRRATPRKTSETNTDCVGGVSRLRKGKGRWHCHPERTTLSYRNPPLTYTFRQQLWVSYVWKEFSRAKEAPKVKPVSIETRQGKPRVLSRVVDAEVERVTPSSLPLGFVC